MKKCLNIFGLWFGTVLTITAQDLNREVLAPQGGIISANGLSGAYTVGEVVVNSYQQATLVISQGFQQGISTTITSLSTSTIAADINVFPNPVSEQLHIDLLSPQAIGWKLHLYDLHSKLVHIQQEDRPHKEHHIVLSVDTLPEGHYQLLILDSRDQLIQAFRIQKSN